MLADRSFALRLLRFAEWYIDSSNAGEFEVCVIDVRIASFEFVKGGCSLHRTVDVLSACFLAVEKRYDLSISVGTRVRVIRTIS